jgi:hypothetical protein
VQAPPLPHQTQPDEQQQQQQQHGAAAAAAPAREAQHTAHGSAAAAAADEQAPEQQQQQQQQQQQVSQYSLGLELLGEAAGLLPHDGPMSAAAAAAATMHSQSHHHLQQQHQHQHQGLYTPSAAAARPRVPSASGRKEGSGRQARASLNQLMYEGSKYGEPSLPIITKPDGVACQVRCCCVELLG